MKVEIHPTLTGTAAVPIGACPDCGCMRYANLVHHCSTLLNPGQVAAAQQPIVIPLSTNANGTVLMDVPAWQPGFGAAAAA